MTTKPEQRNISEMNINVTTLPCMGIQIQIPPCAHAVCCNGPCATRRCMHKQRCGKHTRMCKLRVSLLFRPNPTTGLCVCVCVCVCVCCVLCVVCLCVCVCALTFCAHGLGVVSAPHHTSGCWFAGSLMASGFTASCSGFKRVALRLTGISDAC